VHAVGGGLSGLAAQFSDESALEVCIHVTRYTNRRPCLFFLLFAVILYFPSSRNAVSAGNGRLQ